MKAQWFTKTGWVYLPKSFIGLLLYFMNIVFCVTVFIAVDRYSHSNSDTLYGIFPYIVSGFTLLFWIASNKSGHKIIDTNHKTSTGI